MVRVTSADSSRVAILIGIDDYEKVGVLKNCVGDVERLSKKLGGDGFDVILKRNSSKKALDTLLEDKVKSSNATILFIYFAGHGVEVEGENYLIPVDFAIDNISQLKQRGLPVKKVLEAARISQARNIVVVLDACRDNPFDEDFMSNYKGGLAEVKSSDIPPRLLMVYSGAPGETVLDGDVGQGSPFNESLIKNIRPGRSPAHVFADTADAMNGMQKPWIKFDGEANALGEMITIPLVGKKLHDADFEVIQAIAKKQGKEKRAVDADLEKRGVMPGYSDAHTIEWGRVHAQLRSEQIVFLAEAFFPQGYFGGGGVMKYLEKEELKLNEIIEENFDKDWVREHGFGAAVEISAIDQIDHYENILIELWAAVSRDQLELNQKYVLRNAELIDQ